MANNPPLKPFYDRSQIPTEEKNPEFYAFITNDAFAHINVLMILNELRRYDPETLNDPQHRTLLGRLKAYQQLIDFPHAIVNNTEDDGPTDELRE